MIEDRKKVSVIIPVYQVENYLERAVESVLAQTLEEKEIILVDDGSTDASPQICDRFAEEYPGLVKVIHKENEGLGMARNTGVEASEGEYLAFLDSDDTVEPQMYEQMYEKAKEGDFDMVMCDVRIIYVDEDRESVSETYPSDNIDLADYLANGNNITYSVNKLYRRSIWEENRYEKMLFEDIALVPSLVTKYPRIGYVREAFYNYYRRENTISTSFVGDMVDIIKAYRSFLDASNPKYKDEVVYNAAKQILWNMISSRTLFQADFIELLKEYRKDFLLNPYIAQDKNVRKILDYIERETIPETFICAHIGRTVPEGYRDALREYFPQAVFLDAGEKYFQTEELPEAVRNALACGENTFAEEYFALRILCEKGGIVLMPEMRAGLNLKRLRMNRIFFGFEDEEELLGGCFGAQKEHYVIQALLETYEEENIYNTAFLPLRERIRDFLIVQFQLRVNGRNQLLRGEVQVYLPSILAYDMQDGENCARLVPMEVPEGYELVKKGALKMWSDRLMENWNLYKRAANGKPPVKEKPVSPRAGIGGISEREVQERIQEVIDNYEKSTSWRLTRPIRRLGKLFGKP